MVHARLLRRSLRTVHIFSGALTILLVVSYYLVLPVLAKIESNGKTYSIQDLQSYTAELRSEVLQLQQQREELLQPVQVSEYYDQLKTVQSTKYVLDFVDFLYKKQSVFTLGNEQLLRFTQHTIQQENSVYTMRLQGEVSADATIARRVIPEFLSMVSVAYPQAILQNTHFSSVTTEGREVTLFTLHFAFYHDQK